MKYERVCGQFDVYAGAPAPHPLSASWTKLRSWILIDFLAALGRVPKVAVPHRPRGRDALLKSLVWKALRMNWFQTVYTV